LGSLGSLIAVYQYDWSIFFRSIFLPDGQILSGIWLTVSIAVTAQIIGVILGTLAALARMSKTTPLRLFAGFYVWFFRGTPLLVQISFVFYGLSVSGIYTWPDFVVPGVGFIVAGAVLAFAVTVHNDRIDVQTTGVILLLVGIFDLLLNFGLSMYERRPAVMHNPYPSPAQPVAAARRAAPVRTAYPDLSDGGLHTTQPIEPIRPDSPDWR